MKVPFDIFIEITQYLDLSDFFNLCESNENYKSYCNEISRIYLSKYKVDYKDPTNFIYVANKTSIKKYIDNDYINYTSILWLYYQYYDETNISLKYLKKKITSFPIYPKLIKLNVSGHSLTSFPSQPNLEELYINHNRLTSFSVQPNLVKLHIQYNNLTFIPTLPKLSLLIANRNRLTSLSIQPELVDLDISYNPLILFIEQPKLEYVEISDNQSHFFTDDSTEQVKIRII
jgi:hypothetical protein